jgi:hypothetical protein
MAFICGVSKILEAGARMEQRQVVYQLNVTCLKIHV